ncbi:MAG: aminodeoxychorismate/anthranilate synthase component II [Pseudomonadota bacterium]
MILLIDNYDSFTWNLYHLIGGFGVPVEVVRNDEITPEAALDGRAEAIVLSPGPCTPNEAGICLDLIRKNDGQIPLMGVCLGHQGIGQAYGGTVIRADKLFHGKTSQIKHDAQGLFAGLPDSFTATRYHSLIVAEDDLPDCLDVTARTADGLIMGLQHKTQPVHGVQFHPESIASEHGAQLVANFLKIAGIDPKAYGRNAA